MKNLKAPFLVIALLLLNFSFADSHQLPVPYGAKTVARTSVAETEGDDGMDPEDPNDPNDCGGAPCQYEFPIDENITFLLVGGLVLGAAVVYKNQIKKASI
ncbi:hypothetical protein [Flavobacterium anhuiense]|uniref:hypothetical protein n=1 Tax=Flavobacterium anhuiense TaxID=459526 RepID=UPI003D9639BF